MARMAGTILRQYMDGRCLAAMQVAPRMAGGSMPVPVFLRRETGVAGIAPGQARRERGRDCPISRRATWRVLTSSRRGERAPGFRFQVIARHERPVATEASVVITTTVFRPKQYRGHDGHSS